MKYERKKRKVLRWEGDKKVARMEWALEWTAPDGTRYRSPQKPDEQEGHSAILDRRRAQVEEVE